VGCTAERFQWSIAMVLEDMWGGLISILAAGATIGTPGNLHTVCPSTAPAGHEPAS